MKKQFSLALLILALAASGAGASEKLEVSVGYSDVIGPVANMATVIVGDESVADATLGGGGTIILTGRTLGATNLIVLDEAGRQLLSSPLHVVPVDRRPTTRVRVLKGATAAQDYLCGPDAGCDPVEGPGAAATVMASGDNATASPPGAPADPAVPADPAAPATPETGAPAAQEQVSLNP